MNWGLLVRSSGDEKCKFNSSGSLCTKIQSSPDEDHFCRVWSQEKLDLFKSPFKCTRPSVHFAFFVMLFDYFLQNCAERLSLKFEEIFLMTSRYASSNCFPPSVCHSIPRSLWLKGLSGYLLWNCSMDWAQLLENILPKFAKSKHFGAKNSERLTAPSDQPKILFNFVFIKFLI